MKNTELSAAFLTSQKAKKPFVLSGVPVAGHLFKLLAPWVSRVEERRGFPPCLAVLSVGTHAPSQIYIARKKAMAERLGMHCRILTFQKESSCKKILEAIEALNQDTQVDGLILQLPVPDSWPVDRLLEAITPEKDVDGLHPLNRGRLFSSVGTEGFVPCTPWGCIALLKAYDISLRGKHVVVVGRSSLVGRPLAAYALRHDATVTIAHSQTPELAAVTKTADILCVATGKRGLITPAHVAAHHIVLDVGIHRGEDNTLAGDVCCEKVLPRVCALSPVPGGIGPLTVMGLMANTLKAAARACSLPQSLPF